MNQYKKGRPTKYSQELATEICDVIASTPQGIKRLCELNPHWPNKDTIFSWRKNHPEFSDQYAIAKQHQVECVIDELLDIADDSSKDQVIDCDGQIHFNSQAVQRSRLRIDTRKWLACKLVPKVYGSAKNDQVPPLSLVEKLMFNM